MSTILPDHSRKLYIAGCIFAVGLFSILKARRSNEQQTAVVKKAVLKLHPVIQEFHQTTVFDPIKLEQKEWKHLKQQVATLNQQGHHTKIIHFVRHGQGIHNVAEATHGTEKWEAELALSDEYFDPCLTTIGQNQCQELGDKVTVAFKNGMVLTNAISSPFTRCLETAEYALHGSPIELSFPKVVILYYKSYHTSVLICFLSQHGLFSVYNLIFIMNFHHITC